VGSESRPEKSSKVAIALSGVLPGAGQIYAEDLAKGVIFFLVSLVLDAALLEEGYWDLGRGIFSGQLELTMNLYIRLLVLVLFRIGVLVDADRTVKRRNAVSGALSSRKK